MKACALLLSGLLLSVFAVAPASAELAPVAAKDLNKFVGTEMFGAAYQDLGVVISQVDPNLGLVGVSGKHGEFAVLHMSLLRRDGRRIFAPTLNVGYLRQISMSHWQATDLVAVAKPTMTPSITVTEEEPFVVESRHDIPQR